jgi:hypothetical protein
MSRWGGKSFNTNFANKRDKSRNKYSLLQKQFVGRVGGDLPPYTCTRCTPALAGGARENRSGLLDHHSLESVRWLDFVLIAPN